MRTLRFLALVALLAMSGRATLTAGPAKPHIVVFLADDHGQLDSGPYGARDVRTPNMDRLAREGMTFTHAFVASPACAPSRASILTGLMPNRHGAMANHARPRSDVRTWPAYLRTLGYVIAAFGKVAHYNQDSLYGFDRYQAGHDVKTVAAFLKTRKEAQPLCLIVGTHAPHVPWPETATYEPADVTVPVTHVDTPQTREMRARYYTDVTGADSDLGDILKLVRAQLGDNVLFIYSSDHGAQWPFGKWNLYDAGIRVPLLAVWPGTIAPGSRSAAMVSLIDLLPTLIDAAGGAPPQDIDGRSFADVLRGKKAEHRDSIFATHSRDGMMNVYPIRAVRTRNLAYLRNLDPSARHTTHIDKAKGKDGLYYWTSWLKKADDDKSAAKVVTRYHQRSAEELYDMTKDPHQLVNLVQDRAYSERLGHLRAELDEWMRHQGDRGLETEKDLTLGAKKKAD